MDSLRFMVRSVCMLSWWYYFSTPSPFGSANLGLCFSWLSLLLIGSLPFGKNIGGIVFFLGSLRFSKGFEVNGGSHNSCWIHGGWSVLPLISPVLLVVVVISIFWYYSYPSLYCWVSCPLPFIHLWQILEMLPCLRLSLSLRKTNAVFPLIL